MSLKIILTDGRRELVAPESDQLAKELPTMTSMKNTIEALRTAGLRDRVKILVGGAPVTKEFADEIGADGFGENASVAVTLARKFTARAEAA